MKHHSLRPAAAVLAILLLGGMCLPMYAAAEGSPNVYDPEAVRRTAEDDLTRAMRLGSDPDALKGTCYYISADGDDGQDGQSEDTAFRTFAPINALVLQPGDRVLLRRGDLWTERLELRGKGTDDAWIFVGTYGDPEKPAPEIRRNGERDDIGVLVSDLCAPTAAACGFSHIWIDGLTITKATLGICFRAAVTNNNDHIRVTNCRFREIRCDELQDELMRTFDWLASPKGHLPILSQNRIVPEGGGVYEYVWPTAINFCGRPSPAMASVEVPGRAKPCVRFSEIELYQDEFDGCAMCVGANAYSIHYGAGPHQCFTYTQNWRVEGLTSTNCMEMFNIDSASFGWDGSDSSEWGIFEHCLALTGTADYTSSSGTTQAMFSCCRDLCIRSSQFNDCRNGGQPDGCGFDFERAVFHFLLDGCVFAANEGQGVLMMQTTMEDQVTHEQVTTDNGDCTLRNCLFWDNMRHVCNDNYRFSFLMFNAKNEGIIIDGCGFYERKNTAGGAVVPINQGKKSSMRPVGPETHGVTFGHSDEQYADELPPLAELIAARGMTDATLYYPVRDKVWTDYVGQDPTETEPDTQADTEPETAPAEESEPATQPETAPVTDPAGDESGTSGPSDTSAAPEETSGNSQDDRNGGCASAVSASASAAASAAAAALAALPAAALMFGKKKGRKNENE